MTGCLRGWYEDEQLPKSGSPNELSGIRRPQSSRAWNGLNLYLYQYDRKSFGNQQRISIVFEKNRAWLIERVFIFIIGYGPSPSVVSRAGLSQ